MSGEGQRLDGGCGQIWTPLMDGRGGATLLVSNEDSTSRC